MEELLRTYAQYVSWITETIAITCIALGAVEAVVGMFRVAFFRHVNAVSATRCGSNSHAGWSRP